MVCSKCGKEFTNDVKFCTNCGAEMGVATETEAVAVPEEKKEEVVAESNVAAEEATAPAEVSEEGQTAEETVVQEAPAENKAEQTEAVAEEAAKPENEEVKAADDKKKKEKATKEGDKKLGKSTIALALVAILLCIFIPAISKSGKKDYMAISDKSVLDVYMEEGSRFAYFVDGKKLAVDDMNLLSDTYQSQDMTVFCYWNEDDELVVIKNGKVIKTGIDEAKGIKISSCGDTLVYFSDCEQKKYKDKTSGYEYEGTIEVGTLHLYYIKKNKDVTVAEEVVVSSAVLSPNGETVAYVADYDATDDFKGYYSVGGKKEVEVGKEKRVFAIADKGAYVYYMDVDRLYVQKKKKDEEKLAGDIYSVKAYVNADCSELLFTNDGKTYITVNGKEKQKVSGNVLNKILLNNDAATSSQKVRGEQGYVTVNYTGVESLTEQLYYTDVYSIVYLKDDYETERVASYAESFVVSDDGESMVYVNGNSVVKVTDFEKNGTNKDLNSDEDARAVYADGDLKYVYFLNDQKELYYIKGKKEVKIADDVTSVTMSADGEFCYYVVEKEKFFYSKKGGKGKELYREDDARITCESDYGISVASITEDSTETIYRLDGKKMEVIMSYEASMLDDLLGDEYDWQDIYDSLIQ